MGWFTFGWWATTDTDCTPEQLTQLATGFISSNQLAFNAFDADSPLMCAESLTGGEFQEEWLSRQEITVETLGRTPDGYAPALESSFTADAVSMYASMIHKLVVDRDCFPRRSRLGVLCPQCGRTYWKGYLAAEVALTMILHRSLTSALMWTASPRCMIKAT